MLKVKDINVYYGKIHALKNVSFEVRPGEVVALIGANGAGKSTTLKTVSGMMHSRTGSIEFLGEDITHTPSHNLVYKGLAHVPEGRRIFQQMTVLENLEMGAYLHKKPMTLRLWATVCWTIPAASWACSPTPAPAPICTPLTRWITCGHSWIVRWIPLSVRTS